MSVVWILLAICVIGLIVYFVGKLAVVTFSLALCIFLGGCVPNLHNMIDPAYGNTIAYAGWTDDERIYENALNKDILQERDGVHYPVFKMDTFEEFERFKSDYNDVFTMNQGYDNVLSVNDTLKKAQWDRAIFYEEHTLLAIYVPANSGSLRFYVCDVQTENETFHVFVMQEESKVNTADMAGWLIFMEIKDEEVAEYKYFNANLSQVFIE
ncbi:MAG: hypothetical protein J6S04_01725 [Clostridia bacterium]|nr:hypothetical protein [Clostridia bacterium]